MASAGGDDGEPEFQVAPLIDVLLVMLIFFMSITSAQVLKLDKDIELPLALNGEKRDDKAAAGLINVGWNSITKEPRYKLDDQLIIDTDTETPLIESTKEPLVELLKRRKGNNENFRVLIRADKKVQAKFLSKAIQWSADAGCDNIAFSGVNNEL